MHIKKNIVIPGKHKRPILLDLFLPESITQKSIVIFCHGYKGFKDWGAWHLVAHSFVSSGYCFVKFNFSHNGGTVEQPIDFPDPEAFGLNNYTKELDDLQTVIEWLSAYEFNTPLVNPHSLILIGHSRGGGIACVKAAEEPRVKALVSWAGISDLSYKFSDKRMLDFWEMMGVVYVENSRIKQKLPHYYQFYEDFKAHQERFNIKNAVGSLTIPYLILHGTNDTSILPDHAEKLKQWATHGTLNLIENANHVFGVSHPWKASNMPPHLKETVRLTKGFLKNKKALL